MRETTSRGWQHWRITTVQPTPSPVPFNLMARLTNCAEPVNATAEPAGPDGIRHELVARIRQQIADGTYDTEEKWLLAEEALLRRIEGM